MTSVKILSKAGSFTPKAPGSKDLEKQIATHTLVMKAMEESSVAALSQIMKKHRLAEAQIEKSNG
ncbi:hypothetical protein Tiera_003 [Polaromonas phage Tiera]|nr:hypothetical protein Tiera_003 [Polaromonas phage Tiera]